MRICVRAYAEHALSISATKPNKTEKNEGYKYVATRPLSTTCKSGGQFTILASNSIVE